MWLAFYSSLCLYINVEVVLFLFCFALFGLEHAVPGETGLGTQGQKVSPAHMQRRTMSFVRLSFSLSSNNHHVLSCSFK